MTHMLFSGCNRKVTTLAPSALGNGMKLNTA